VVYLESLAAYMKWGIWWDYKAGIYFFIDLRQRKNG